MNSGTVTGGVVREACEVYTPARERRVQFTIAVTDSHRNQSFWNCEAEGDPSLLKHCLDNAQPGRGVKIEYELATKPYIKRGHHVGEMRFLRVRSAEFSERHAPAEEVTA